MPSEAARPFAAAFRSGLPNPGGDTGDGGDTPGGAAELRRSGPAAPVPGGGIAGGDSGDIPTGDTALSPLSPVRDRQAGTPWRVARTADFCGSGQLVPGVPAVPGGNAVGPVARSPSSICRPNPERAGFVGGESGAFVHYCSTCGAWGSFGYGVDTVRGKPGRWFCLAHRPDAGDQEVRT
ncbi:MAG TPA: hypothetical protein VJ779_09645 [Acetobacteraceae bacterium]|nr:hypothetical protein [Acetobacteraceae bacterium]